jgi:hypothetical protein
MPRPIPPFRSVFGVDFSGARLAGRNTWVARLERASGRSATRTRVPRRLALVELHRLERLAGTAVRGPALAQLVRLIAGSDRALWALDFPFGLPVEVMGGGVPWPYQFHFLRAWGEDAYGAGLECLRRAKALGGPMHIRRLTDREAGAPFDCYHYRQIGDF